jgi:murein DD-endopeptidase MepM/ murein hydrolase activator NlpD
MQNSSSFQNISAFFFLLILNFACQPAEQKEKEITISMASAEDNVAAPPIEFFKTIPLVNSYVVKGRIKWNQTLSKLLEKYDIGNDALYRLDRVSRPVYSVRKLKAGYQYAVIEDTVRGVATHFVFEPDPMTTVIYHLHDTIMAESVRKPVTIVTKSIGSVINSSLYESAIDAGASPLLVSKLVDILAWQVDFFRIQKGDRFKVIYQEEQVEGVAVGISKISGVYFEHFGRPYYGVHFSASNGAEDYFDEEGNSMRKTFLRAPLDYSRISSRFTPKRYHPVLKRYKAHLGTDYAAPVGTPIRTVGDGVIQEARYGKYTGNFVKIKHNSNYTTQYLHMQKIKTGIRQGVAVEQGQVIGYVGQTGLANGPHLCYRFWKNGRQVDALNVDLPPSEPINPEYLNTYLHHKNIIMHQLDLISYGEEPSNTVASGIQ